MLRKKAVIITLFIFMFSIGYSEETRLNIGIVYDGESVMNEKIKGIFLDEAEKLTGKDNVKLVKEVKGKDSQESIRAALTELDGDKSVNVIITLGIIGSYIADKDNNFSKKVIAPFVIKRDFAKDSKNSNVVAITTDFTLKEEISYFIEKSGIKRVIIITDKDLKAAYIEKFDESENMLKTQKIDYKMIEFTNITDNLKGIETGDGVFFCITRELSETEGKNINDILKINNNPSYFITGNSSKINKNSLEADFSKNLEKFARKTAIILTKIYEGEELKRYESIVLDRKKYIASPDFIISKESSDKDENIIIGGNSNKPVKSIKEILNMIFVSNLKLNIQKKEMELQTEEEKIANSNLLPKVTAELAGVNIDENSADSSMGSVRERTVSGSIGLTQVIYSADANVNIDIQKKISEVKKDEIEQKKMDLITEGVITYLNGLKAKANLKIQQEILSANRENLIIAQSRVMTGSINPADLYRWESETATAETNVKKAEAVIKQVKERLKKLALIKEDKEFEIEEVQNIYEFSQLFNEDIKKMIESGKAEELEKIFSEYAMKNSIELKMQKKDYEIRKINLEYAKRSSYLPTIALQANYKRKIYEGGAGDTGLGDILGPALGMTFETINTDNSWNIGIGFSMDLYNGGEKQNKIEKSKISLKKSEEERADAENEIKEGVINEVTNVIVEYKNIKNMGKAVEALKKNHKLVSDAYLKGMINMSDLLSSRNALVYAEQGEVVAKYDFMISVIKLERYSGNFNGITF